MACKDGVTYYHEYADSVTYSFKNYNCPGQGECDLEKKYRQYIERVLSCTDAEKEHLKFMNGLPRGKYYNGGFSYYQNYKDRKKK